MKIADDVFLVGSGQVRISHPRDCNTYLVNGGDEIALIDVGGGIKTELILRNIQEDGFDVRRLKSILLTHGHADHACGGAEIRRKTGCKIIASAKEALLIEKGNEEELGLIAAKLDGCYPQDYVFENYKVDKVIEDKERIKVGKYILEAIVTPGHRIGHVCYLMKQNNYTILLSGDNVFLKGIISLLNCPGSSLKDYREGMSKLKDLSVDALFPGHGLWTLQDGQKHIDLAIQRLRGMFPPVNNGWDNDLRPFMLKQALRRKEQTIG